MDKDVVYMYIYLYNAILLSHKHEILPFAATWMDLELVNITKKKQTHRHREQTSGYQRGEGSREGQHRGGEVGETNH